MSRACSRLDSRGWILSVCESSVCVGRWPLIPPFFAVIPQRFLEVLFLGFKCILFKRKRYFPKPAEEVKGSGVGSGALLVGLSVNEPLAGFLPAARRAPHVPVLHAVHFPALLALSPGLPQADCPSWRGRQDRVCVPLLTRAQGMSVCWRNLEGHENSVNGEDACQPALV